MNCNFSFKLQKAMERAIYIAEDFKSSNLSTFHLALAIFMDDECTLQRIYLESGYKIDYNTMLNSMLTDKDMYKKVTGEDFPEDDEEGDEQNTDNEENISESNENTTTNIYLLVDAPYDDTIYYSNIPYSSNLALAFDDAMKRCIGNGRDYVDEDNLLFSILNNENSSAFKLLKEFKFDISELKNILLLNSNIFRENKTNSIVIPPILESCCEILNNNYTKGEKCEILCRDKEIFTVWNIFSKKNKRNAVLIGSAGVGKTAIVEAITMQIVNETCPKEFKDYSVVSLNINAMLAGTKYRGEFETKVDSLIKFLKANNNIILFVDEIHQMLGAGSSSESGPDLSGSLKPILARNDVVFIGATTLDEYDRYFSRDPAFKRRFDTVIINEPSLKDVKNMISLRVKNISNYHKVIISDEILDYIIITAKAMNYFGKNPDLTVDLLDRAMAIAKMRNARTLTKKDVDKVFQHNYDTFNNIGKKDKKSTAYHEAGHALLKLLAKHDKREDLKIVSIIPTEEYLGVTISEKNEKYKPMTRDAVLESASMSLAGRVAQEFVDENWDFGASSDLEQATNIIRNMIVEKGMDSNIYINISLYDYNSNGHMMSPQAVDRVNERIEEIMKEVYNKTKQILNKNKDKLDIIANLLLKKGIISVEEIIKAFKENSVKI